MTAFRGVLPGIVAEVGRRLETRGLMKEAGAKLDADVAAALEALDLSGFAVLLNPTEAILAEMGLNGARQAMLSVKTLAPQAEAFALPSDAVQTWARSHAADLVGMRVLDDGRVVENPRPEFAITEATREQLRGTIADAFEGDGLTMAELRDRLEASYAFSEERAMVIARHEVGAALREGNLATWRESGVVTGGEWILSDLHAVPDECDEYAGRVFPLDEIPDLPHPLCECDVIPHVGDA